MRGMRLMYKMRFTLTFVGRRDDAWWQRSETPRGGVPSFVPIAVIHNVRALERTVCRKRACLCGSGCVCAHQASLLAASERMTSPTSSDESDEDDVYPLSYDAAESADLSEMGGCCHGAHKRERRCKRLSEPCHHTLSHTALRPTHEKQIHTQRCDDQTRNLS